MKTSKLFPHYASALTALTLVCCLSAANSGTSPSPASDAGYSRRVDNSTLSHSDRSFIEKAAKAGMKEVDVSKAVEGRVTDPQVKATAQMMIADHTAANNELMALAGKKGVTLPVDDMKAGEKWSKKSKDLDDDYIKEMKEDHEEAVKLFEKGAKADDPDVAAFASKTLPTLQHHLSMVKEIKKMK
jgi:putative membrane protein